KTMAAWVAELADLEICFGPVATLGEALADPQVRHRGMVGEVDGGRRTLGNPIKLSDTPPTIRTPPPALGEHTDAVLARLGYSRGDIEGLRARGACWSPRASAGWASPTRASSRATAMRARRCSSAAARGAPR